MCSFCHQKLQRMGNILSKEDILIKYEEMESKWRTF